MLPIVAELTLAVCRLGAETFVKLSLLCGILTGRVGDFSVNEIIRSPETAETISVMLQTLANQ